MNFGKGSATLAYRPISFSGTFTPTELAMGMNFGGDMPIVAPVKTIEPLPAIPAPCADETTPGLCGRGVRRHAGGRALRPRCR